jgi:predicted acylesterase/phospholipase RssA
MKPIVLILLMLVGGCSSLPERNPLPADLYSTAGIRGVPEARFWADEWPTFSIRRLDNHTDADIKRELSGIYNKPHHYLAISGGGANGAYGAGVLEGWSKSGARPEFTMVTGVSTGALTAPFAFLGSDYDDELRHVYTTTATRDIAIKRSLISAFFSDSMTDTEPLKRLIAKNITEDIIEEIGVEHKRGRRLFIGTVNLDASRSVIWNIGAIAASDHPKKVLIIRELMRASAAIPIAFPPVVIPIEASDGTMYDELHVDGGTGSQVFVYPASANWRKIAKQLKVQGEPQIYVIRNSFLDPEYEGIQRQIFPIASRAIATLIRTQGLGDLYQIYALCERDGNDFNLAYIPADFSEEPNEGFDPVYMTKLYEFGYQKGLDGYPWEKAPPGLILK